MLGFKSHLEARLTELNNSVGSYTNTVSAVSRDLDMVQQHGVDAGGKTIETHSFDNVKEARKNKRMLVKKYSLVKHGYNLVNFSDGVELTTTY